MYVGVGNRRAEEIIGRDRELYFLADGGKVFRAFDRHFEFRFLVFLNLEIASRFRVANRGRDVVVAERHFIGEVYVAAETAARR